MDLFTHNELELIVNEQSDFCVSILMPMQRGPAARQNPILFKNLLSEAHERMLARGVKGSQANYILQPAWRLLDEADFWREQAGGMAVYASQSLFRRYRLGLELQRLVVVDRHFAVKPLLPVLAGDGVFHVLAVSQNRVRLLTCTREQGREIPLAQTAVPPNLAEVLKFDVREKQVNFRSQPMSATGGKSRACYHGQTGSDMSSHKKDLLRFLQSIDRGLRDVIRLERAPLVFAGVEYLFPIFREVCTHANLSQAAVEGNPDRLSADELRQRAWQVIEPAFAREMQEAIAHYERARNSGLASSEVSEIVPAAFEGRVGILFSGPPAPQWGHFDAKDHKVTLHNTRQNGDDDLSDFAAVQTLLHGGKVFAPGNHKQEVPLAAIYRY